MVAGDETSCWEDVGKKDGGFLIFKNWVTPTKQDCEQRSMTNHIKTKNGPIYLYKAVMNTWSDSEIIPSPRRDLLIITEQYADSNGSQRLC